MVTLFYKKLRIKIVVCLLRESGPWGRFIAFFIQLHPGVVLHLRSPLDRSLSALLDSFEVMTDMPMTLRWFGIIPFNNEEMPLQNASSGGRIGKSHLDCPGIGRVADN